MRKVGIIVLIIIIIIMIVGLSKVLMFAINHNDWNWFMNFGSSDEVRKQENIRKEEKKCIKKIYQSSPMQKKKWRRKYNK